MYAASNRRRDAFAGTSAPGATLFSEFSSVRSDIHRLLALYSNKPGGSCLSYVGTERLALIANIPILAMSSDAKDLADELMLQHGIPATEPREALHIAIAAVNGIQFLVTLKFTHIANAETNCCRR